jgi:hypothetical protein
VYILRSEFGLIVYTLRVDVIKEVDCERGRATDACVGHGSQRQPCLSPMRLEEEVVCATAECCKSLLGGADA